MNLEEFNQKVEKLEIMKKGIDNKINELLSIKDKLDNKIVHLECKYPDYARWNEEYKEKYFKGAEADNVARVFSPKTIECGCLVGISIYVNSEFEIFEYVSDYALEMEELTDEKGWEEIDKEEYITYLNKLKEHVNGI